MPLRIVFISDTHNQHRKANLPDGDLLIHGGDVSNGSPDQLLDFLDWFTGHSHSYKVFIGGNMDRDLERRSAHYRSLLPDKVFYLENEGIEIEGFRIWGSPVIPNFVGAFNRKRGAEIRAHWEKVPDQVDILLTHTPPKGILDRTSLGMRVGCKDLRERVEAIRPRYHLFGHIHESYGRLEGEYTTFYNGSFVRRFRSGNEPFVIEVGVF